MIVTEINWMVIRISSNGSGFRLSLVQVSAEQEIIG
jgi:hypothetical protein